MVTTFMWNQNKISYTDTMPLRPIPFHFYFKNFYYKSKIEMNFCSVVFLYYREMVYLPMLRRNTLEQNFNHYFVFIIKISKVKMVKDVLSYMRDYEPQSSTIQFVTQQYMLCRMIMCTCSRNWSARAAVNQYNDRREK